MKSFLLIVSLCLLSTGTLFSQTREADSLYLLGIELIDNGDYDRACNVLETGRTRYPRHSIFQYEQAFARYLQKRYEDALTLLKEIIDAPDATDRYYQLLGNTYDLTGKPEKAIEVYKTGLEKFPESGYLYLELGVMAGHKEEYGEAVAYWEQGLTVQPDYSSNFFHAGRMFMGTSERGWGLLYGEIFLNMEISTDRSSMMRAMLWKSYNEAISMDAKKQEPIEEEKAKGATEQISLGGMKFFQTITMHFDDETKQVYMPFPMLFERTSGMASIPVMLEGGDLTVKKLHDFRSGFIDHWFQDTATAGYLNIALYDYQRQLKEAGLLEAYNYQLFYCEETDREVRKWIEENPGKIDELGRWLGTHPYPVDKEHAFSRLRMKGIPLGSGDEGDKEKVKE